MMVVHLVSDGASPAVSDLLAGGRSAALFAFLAGVSLALVRRHDAARSGSSLSIAIRALILFALGLSLGSIGEIGVWVILPYYGLMFLLAIPLLRLPARKLIILAAVWAVLAPFLSFWVRSMAPFRVSGQIEFADMMTPLTNLRDLLIDGIYPVLIWITYVMVGIAVGKLRLETRQVAVRLAVTGAMLLAGSFALAYAFMLSGAVSGWTQSPAWMTLFVQAAQVPTDNLANLALLGIHTDTPLNVLSSVGSSLLVCGLALLLMQVVRPAIHTLSRPLRAAGQMTLTLYTAHLLLNWVAKNHGFMFAGGSYPEWVAQLVLFILFAVFWLRWFRRGPLESVVHWAAAWRPGRSSRPSTDHESTDSGVTRQLA